MPSSSTGNDDSDPVPQSPSLFDFIYLPALSFLAPYYAMGPISGGKFGKLARSISQRLGYYRDLPFDTGARPIWIHGASVGEIQTMGPVRNRLANHPNLDDTPLLLSTNTLTGYEVAREEYPEDPVYFYPLDLSTCVKRALDHVQPRLIVLVEAELWPNLIQMAHRRNIPVAVINARMTENSYHAYRAAPPFLRKILFGHLSLVCARNKRYADRFSSLGVGKNQIRVTGNLKYDSIIESIPTPESSRKLADLYEIKEGEEIFVAGSVHPGEIRAVARAYREWTRARSDRRTRFVLAPRHPENSDRIRSTLESMDFLVHLDSQIQNGEVTPGDVIVVDRIGVLKALYRQATIVFVGGSLIENVGGHNILEPAALEKPVLTGPHTYNFTEEIEFLQEKEGIICVSTEEKLVETVRTFAEQPEKAKQMGAAAKEAVQSHRGAAENTIHHLLRRLQK